MVYKRGFSRAMRTSRLLILFALRAEPIYIHLFGSIVLLLGAARACILVATESTPGGDPGCFLHPRRAGAPRPR